MISVRSATPELAGTRLVGFATNNPGVLGYQRPGDGTLVLVLANFSDGPQEVQAVTLSGFAAYAVDILTGAQLRLDAGLLLRAQQFLWLRVTPRHERPAPGSWP
jgi:amylosucrase